MKVVYIAGRFTAPTAWEIEQNVRRAEALAAEVAQLGAMPLCPHTNSRFFFGLIGTTAEFWYDGTLELLRRCDALILVPGWEGSTGTAAEREEAWRLKIPQFHYMTALKDWLADGAPSYYERPEQIATACSRCGVKFETFRAAVAHEHKENA